MLKYLGMLLLGVGLGFAQITTLPQSGGIGGSGTANVSATSAGAVTSLAIDINSLNLTSVAGGLLQCWTGTGPYTPVTITNFGTTGTSPITTITPTFSSTANITCRFNSSGATGPAGTPGTPGTPGATGAPGAPGAISTIKDEGTSLAVEPYLNFIGTGITCVDNPGATRTDCTISGGSATVDPASVKDAIDCPASSGSGTAYVCATTNTTTLASGQRFLLGIDATSTGNATLVVNSSSAKPLLHKNLSQFAAGDLVAGDFIELRYDGTEFVPVAELLSTNPGQNIFKCGTAPGTPASGYTIAYCPSGGVPTWKDDAGVVHVAVVGDAGASHYFLTAISASTGAISKAQPAVADLSDAATVQTKASAQSGAVNYCAPASASATTYTCTLTPTLAAYTAGMNVSLKIDTSCTGGTSTTLNIDTLGAKRIYQADGSTDPASGDCPASRQLALRYDGTAFRIVGGGATSGAGSGATVTSGVYASVPTCNAQNIYITTDAPLIAYCNGSTRYWKYKGLTVTPTQIADFPTAFNMTGASATNEVAGFQLIGSTAGASAFHGRYMSVPATPYTVGACFEKGVPLTNYSAVAVGWTDGTKLEVDSIGMNGGIDAYAVGIYYTDATTYGGTQLALPPAAPAVGGTICFALSDNGTNWHHLMSFDGVTWIQTGTEARNGNLTATGVGVFVVDPNTGAGQPVMEVKGIINVATAY